ncbi:uncharacterized protein E0L32_009238 [Thyridium curvatum]|uniref:DUF7779 domain-containing protein n=1 Tax=Thyridium curvatum TaxID=1093900 RepID=A0A507AHM3_9PEZI|nr:uncharacterized protein E0L32_009238 [Thyridium curvatum]TPX09495.1 hypothetical protein E0L32_009238 [Thyridium curvatum]
MVSDQVENAILGVEKDFLASFPGWEGQDILKLTDYEKVMQWIEKSADWRSPWVSQSLHVRIDGIGKTCKEFISVVHTSRIVPDEVNKFGRWPALVLGSLALCIREILRIGDSSRNPFLPLLEELTINTSLPLPPFNRPSNDDRPFAEFLLQLFVQLAHSLLKLALFMVKNQSEHRKDKPTEGFTKLSDENREAVRRLGALCDKLRGCILSNSSDTRSALPHLEQQTTGTSLNTYHSFPARFSRHFQGRGTYFTRIDQIFATSPARPALVSLYGLPGIGKTQLAMRYCNSQIAQYKVILWTEADTPMKIQEGLSKHAVNLGLPGAELRGDNDTWLLVYDNVDDRNILRQFWPEGGKGHIIVTTRDPFTANFRASDRISVLPLNMKESKNLFYDEIGRSPIPQQNPRIEKLLGEWEGVPLAINQMSSFITRLGMDLDQFVKLYDTSKPRLLQKEGYEEYPHSVATAFATEQLQQNPKAVMHAMCFFDPDRIPCEVIQSSFDSDETQGFNSVMCQMDYLDSLETLIRMSLLTKVDNDISIHRLVQDVVYLFMSKEDRQKAFDAVLSVLSKNFPTNAEGQMWKEWLWPLAGILIENNRITEALPLLMKALQIREALLPANDPALGITYYSIGLFYMEYNQLEKSLEYNLKALDVRQRCSDPDEGPLAFTYGNLGLIYRRMGELDKGSDCMEKGEELWRRSYGDNSDRYAICMYYLGNLRLDQGRIAEARQCHQKSFDIYCKILPRNFKTGLCWHKMATFFRRDDDFCNAEAYVRKALSIFEKCFDPTPRLARSTYLLSEVLRDSGRILEADEKRQAAERLRESITTLPYEKDSTPEAFERLVPYFLR